jgi:pyruvate dehydrogenase E2 component (dihydrolipoamide acetyltransferase)
MAEVFNTQNLGAYGIETGTPIINAPQSTLVFAGAIVRTVVPGENDEIRIAPIMKLSVCFDHRFIDGVTAAAFTTSLKTRLENLVPADLD